MGLSISEIIFIVVLVVLVLSVGQLPAVAETIARIRHKVPRGPKKAVDIGPPPPQDLLNRAPDASSIKGPTEDAELIDSK